MKVALVHDYLKDFGGAERVLLTLSEIYPKAPIYTAFCVKNSDAHQEFKNRKIIESKFAPILRPWRLYSPLRFLLPWIWGSMDLSNYDLVITSCSNYIARGFKTSKKTHVIAYCHTPPRFLYGYQTGLNLQKYLPVKIYADVISHFLRIFDYNSAQKINYWIANSQNVKARIKKFYRKDAVVIYPPIEVEELMKAAKNSKKENYYLIVARLVATKGILDAVKAAKSTGIKLKIAGGVAGYGDLRRDIEKIGGDVEILGRVDNETLWQLYAKAKGFIALARDEDFGMTVVEAQAGGTPVIAYNGGGFKESIINDKTGFLINDTDVRTIKNTIEKFEKKNWNRELIQNHAQKFSKERFKKEVLQFVKQNARITRS